MPCGTKRLALCLALKQKLSTCSPRRVCNYWNWDIVIGHLGPSNRRSEAMRIRMTPILGTERALDLRFDFLNGATISDIARGNPVGF